MFVWLNSFLSFNHFHTNRWALEETLLQTAPSGSIYRRRQTACIIWSERTCMGRLKMQVERLLCTASMQRIKDGLCKVAHGHTNLILYSKTSGSEIMNNFCKARRWFPRSLIGLTLFGLSLLKIPVVKGYSCLLHIFCCVPTAHSSVCDSLCRSAAFNPESDPLLIN